MQVEVFNNYESNVRSYCRNFKDVFYKAKNAVIFDELGREYIDFFAGAGALNYGHNNEYIKDKVIAYLLEDGIIHGLDMHTVAKGEFIEKFIEGVLKPKGLDYKLQFCGPTGTNAVEAALKLARKVKNRTGIFSFMGGFHGMSLGSLSVTGNIQHRKGAGLPLQNVTFMPYPYGFMKHFDTLDYMESVLNDPNSGIDVPAAVIVETVQAEGGIIVAPTEWLRRLRDLCNRYDILLICDEIQVGCGRTGSFFSFENAEIIPDMVVLSKSIGGYGLPMSLLLLKPELDIWKPGEHNGTFRGNQLAFVAAKAAIEYWERFDLQREIQEKTTFLERFLNNEIKPLHTAIDVRGRGLIWGMDFVKLENLNLATAIAKGSYEKGLIIESAGRNDTVLKIMPPLTIEMSLLEKGCTILKDTIKNTL
ncbi:MULTISPECIES: diaminobutyrate--2-oxoglutarate transaminase [Bacillus cereus group]|uniref:Diaminobutyrate--2-oxoglutarate transaminase n=1 Tax=Bacillus thuringiensis TaxID=1428 RepID=A0AB33B620_BACTU|nr:MULTISPECIES: diaminobutyrate--2-oxoglutarate transaminase [Bacillus cereus group]QXW42470.1 diaminobutyrate--2-oxoglutarate transaminase [Klebsiella grimontii]HDR7534311.1 diaminobutyrate--2-oxoglutarate transaminase [Bacillus anthracis]AJG79597.1 diaminobutyrate--2-oxoglutarate aminotransferase [Bacillus thuringiensis]EEK53068.1 Diaminobutyrate--2-oxoglutarate aminotransferase [Bacillus cereus BGSC 6E1]EEM74086.1 Diaminobutyrate--2-oxoglutarate aminotransferase [Bacillus thuringiensis ser